ncbi:MAG: metallophosphoesterase [Candidatus Dormibacteria bacterium]
MRLLHIADLHLDRAFGGLAFAGCDGAERRRLLRRSLEWAVDLAAAESADALLIAGDLFEQEHVTADTVAFITRQLGRLGCPVLVSSGNHDPATSASPYRVAQWPSNVVLALEPKPTVVDLRDAVVVGLGYTGKDLPSSVLDRVPARGEDRRPRLLLVHGVDMDLAAPGFRWGGLGLRAADLDRLGFEHALMGHVHAGAAGARLSWPGTPVPLDPSEVNGLHGALWVDIVDGCVSTTPVSPGLAHFQTVPVDVTEISDSSALAASVGVAVSLLEADRALVTVRLHGRRQRSLSIDPAALASQWCDAVLGLSVADATVPEVDLTELAREPTARGAAVAHLLADGSEDARQAAQLVAEAFDGALRVPA